jgi:hypothetical protein
VRLGGERPFLPVEVPELRTKLRRVVNGSGAPQLLLRLGYGPAVRPTPKRPLEDVIHRV